MVWEDGVYGDSVAVVLLMVGQMVLDNERPLFVGGIADHLSSCFLWQVLEVSLVHELHIQLVDGCLVRRVFQVHSGQRDA